MWFKNLQIYRFTRPFDLTVDQLETQLEACAFTPCGSQDISRFGWVKPLGKFGSTLTHSASSHILLCARKEEKMLPGTVVKEMLAEKVEAIEFEQGRALKKKEKEALKEEIMHTLLPRAFSRTSQTFAWISPTDNLMVVDAGSAKKADDLLALLRKSIGSLSNSCLIIAFISIFLRIHNLRLAVESLCLCRFRQVYRYTHKRDYCSIHFSILSRIHKRGFWVDAHAQDSTHCRRCIQGRHISCRLLRFQFLPAPRERGLRMRQGRCDNQLSCCNSLSCFLLFLLCLYLTTKQAE